MTHIEPEALAGYALDDTADLDSTAREHLAGCAECSAYVAELRQIVVAADGGAPELTSPPASVWDRIRSELDQDSVSRPGRSPALRLVAACVAGILIGVAGLLAWQQMGGGGEGSSVPPNGGEQVVASTVLRSLTGNRAEGEARLVTTDGHRQLQVTLDKPSEIQGYREVWLLNKGASKLVSLGVMSGRTAKFPVPAGFDLSELSVVDVSAEPYDGDPAHSGNSLARGDLEQP